MLWMIGIATILLALLAALIAGCGNPSAEPTPASTPTRPALGTLRLASVLEGEVSLEFMGLTSPTNLVQAGNGEVFITDRAGLVLSFDETVLRRESEHIFSTAFLDIRDRVSSRGSEEGLLGLALAPYNDEHLYVYYSAANPRRSVVSRFNYYSPGRYADPDTELVILEVPQPYANHNGGQLAFGPRGYLYIGLGDGGAAGDPLGNGQDTSTLLGSILRIDVSQSTPEQPYAIPPDNPFAAGGGRGEIWAYGLRNPWRFSFDRETGELWAGDVGQNQWEEIDLIQKGGNYGWNTLEGNHCFAPRDDCDRDGKIPPVFEYPLDGQPCSVIGGYVYRGASIPWLTGAYVYGDFCSGKVYGLRHANGQVIEHKELASTGLRIMSFAQDNDGELYLLSQSDGIHRLTADP